MRNLSPNFERLLKFCFSRSQISQDIDLDFKILPHSPHWDLSNPYGMYRFLKCNLYFLFCITFLTLKKVVKECIHQDKNYLMLELLLHWMLKWCLCFLMCFKFQICAEFFSEGITSHLIVLFNRRINFALMYRISKCPKKKIILTCIRKMGICYLEKKNEENLSCLCL